MAEYRNILIRMVQENATMYCVIIRIPTAIRHVCRKIPMSVVLGLVLLCTGNVYADSLIAGDNLIADVRQLANIIESVHPDPYHNIGGRIEFHRQLQEIIRAIPEAGINRADFYELLGPFVTGLGDSHTWLRFPEESSFSPDLPLYFGIISDGVFVAGVPSEEYRPLLAARLVSIESVPAQEIITRARRYVSAENKYQILRNLGSFGLLADKWFLDRLIPACRDQSHVVVSLLLADGTPARQSLECSIDSTLSSYVWITSRYSLPSRERADFVYSFTDSRKHTALLIIDNLNTFREAFEMWKSKGRFNDGRKDASRLYQRYNGSEPPNEEEDLISGLP